MRRLILLRHAKSDWDASFHSDRDRPLSERGRRAAAAMGVAVRDLSLVPDVVWTSPAVRAATTAELAASSGRWKSPIRVVEELYGTGAHAVVGMLPAVDPATRTLMLVGHEPTWSSLTALLTGGQVAVKTATLVAIDLHGDWPQADRGGEVWCVLQPRSFVD